MDKFFFIPLLLLASSQPLLGAETNLPAADHHLHVQSQAVADALLQIEGQLGSAKEIPHPHAITAEDVLAALDAAGIDKGLILSNAYVFSMPELNPGGEYPLVSKENDYVAAQVAKSPDRLSGLCSVNPLADYALDEIQRCAQQLGLAGLKLHFANSDINLRSSTQIGELAALFEFLEVLNYPVLLHLRTRDARYGATDVKLFIDNVLSKAPSIDIQIAHFAGWGGYDAATDRAIGEFVDAFKDGRLEPSHIQFDLAAVINDPENKATTSDRSQLMQSNNRLAERIRQLDSQQVLFATDWPVWPRNTDLLDKIPVNIERASRLLPLSNEELKLLFSAESRLFNRKPR